VRYRFFSSLLLRSFLTNNNVQTTVNGGKYERRIRFHRQAQGQNVPASRNHSGCWRYHARGKYHVQQW
jgi:hypothetical protein